MLTLGPLVFAVPWALAALAVLPVLWWLLRVIPPAPQRISFPAIRLLEGLRPEEDTPHSTPWWLLLLRLLIATLVILAIARPLIPSGTAIPPGGPILLVVDDGWSAARDFEARRDRVLRILDQAERENRPVALVTTADPMPGQRRDVDLSPPSALRSTIGALQPKPWGRDLDAVAELIDGAGLDATTTVVWLRESIAAADSDAFGDRLASIGPVVVIDGTGGGPVWINDPDPAALTLTAELRRGTTVGDRPVAVRAIAEDGRVLTRQTAAFEADSDRLTVEIDLPTELRNDVARLEVEEEDTAASVFLMDERYKRRPVGLVSARDFEGSQPLLDELYYLDRALDPFTEVRRGTIDDLLERDLAVVVLADAGGITFEQRQKLETFLQDGGVVLRFAGERLAASDADGGGDTLLPVRVRRGDRTLGGALSWSRPEPLAPFDSTSPFAGIAVPDDVTVSRQVLAEPSIDLGDKTWARLVDGTPLVTAERRGDGWLVLVHTTANADWSNLPLSGLFVAMLRRIVALSQGVGGTSERAMPPYALLDGFGTLGGPVTGTEALPSAATRAELGMPAIGPRHPPGFYGDENAREALNLGPSLGDAVLVAGVPTGAVTQALEAGRDTELQGWMLAVALLLAILDTLIGLALRGLLPGRMIVGGAGRGAAVLVLASLVLAPGSGLAQQPQRQPGDPEAFALAAASEMRLGYVLTGDTWIDGISHDGLTGLSDELTRRTAVEPAAPFGVDVERDELAFFPLLYWPITREQPELSGEAVVRVNQYMRNGGIIIFDTRDQYEVAVPGAAGGSGLRRLVQLSQALDIPPLAPASPDHVLTRAFYLLDEFPGRYVGGTVWLEDERVRSSDTEVSPVLVGSHDWAGAWARDAAGRPRFPVVPGGELQREMATRFGINLVMYALTGNYKADQVHVPSILERLGQ
ncbi:MAG: DUF4159 domain-containing protein [Thalassobaculaceae bacterium]|nr:DUF4159 domain-containing protein [Thalassobaculaceae bacterium]